MSSPHAAAPADQGRTPLMAWWMLAVLLLFYSLSFVDRMVISMLVDPIKASLGLSDVQMSLILGPAFALSYGVLGIPIGWLADRFSRRGVIFGGVMLWSVSAAGSGLTSSFGQLLAARVGVGGGEAALTPAAYSLMTDRFPARRLTVAMSIYQSGVKIGSAAAFAMGSVGIALAATYANHPFPVVGTLEPWRLALLFTAGPGLLLAFLAFTFGEPRRIRAVATSAQPVDGALFAFLRSEWRVLSLLAFGMGLVTMTVYSVSAWSPTYITRQFGWQPPRYAPILSVISLAGAASMIVKGMIVDWLYGRGMKDAHLRFYTWLIAVAIPFAGYAYLVDNVWLFLIGYTVINVVALQYVVFAMATLQMIVPRVMRARVSAIFLGLFSIMGLGAGPTLTAMLTDYVFRDEMKLGWSLTVTTLGSLVLGFISLRLTLKPIRAAMARNRETVAA